MHACRLGTTGSPAEAAHLIQQDDGKGTGVLYAGQLPVWQPGGGGGEDLPDIEAGFRV